MLSQDKKKQSKKKVTYRRSSSTTRPKYKPRPKRAYTVTPKRYTPSKSTYSADIGRYKSLMYMSPFGKIEPPVNNNSLGNFTTLNLLSRFEFSTSTTIRKVLLFNPSVRGIYQVALWNQDGSVASNDILDSSPTYKLRNEAPVNMRPMRAGLRIRNTTANQDVAGIVRMLQQSSALEFEFINPLTSAVSVNFIDEIVQSVEQNPKSHEMTGQELCKGHNEQVISPCVYSQYNSYGNNPFNSNIGAEPLQVSFNNMVRDMPMNICVMVFEPTSSINTYSITLAEQVATRYPATTILNELGKSHIKSKNDDFINKVHEHVALNHSKPVNISYMSS